MMVDIQEMRGLDGLERAARAVRRGVEHDNEVGLEGLLFRTRSPNIISRQHRKDGRDIIIEQNARILAERAQDVHEPKGRPDGIAVGVPMGRDDHALSAGKNGRRFTQCYNHVNVLLSRCVLRLPPILQRTRPRVWTCPLLQSLTAAPECERCNREIYR